MLTIMLKRAYEKPARGDGIRVLVDRLWPRGIKKEDLRLDTWAKALAPSTELRKWFAHDETKWPDFRKRYRAELSAAGASKIIRDLLASSKRAKTITLLYGAKDQEAQRGDRLARPLRARGSEGEHRSLVVPFECYSRSVRHTGSTGRSKPCGACRLIPSTS